MSDNQQNSNVVIIDGAEYDTSKFSQEQVTLLRHCVDLENKISNSLFVTQQLQVGKDAFLKMLKDSLENPTETVTQ